MNNFSSNPKGGRCDNFDWLHYVRFIWINRLPKADTVLTKPHLPQAAHFGTIKVRPDLRPKDSARMNCSGCHTFLELLLYWVDISSLPYSSKRSGSSSTCSTKGPLLRCPIDMLVSSVLKLFKIRPQTLPSTDHWVCSYSPPWKTARSSFTNNFNSRLISLYPYNKETGAPIFIFYKLFPKLTGPRTHTHFCYNERSVTMLIDSMNFFSTRQCSLGHLWCFDD